MFFKKYRLTKRNDFQSIFKHGKKNFGKYFSLRFKKNSLDYSRITVVVSSKVSKNAVVRNTIKRRVRAITKPLISQFQDNFDIIISVMSPAVNMDFNFLEKDLENLLKKNKIL